MLLLVPVPLAHQVQPILPLVVLPLPLPVVAIASSPPTRAVALPPAPVHLVLLDDVTLTLVPMMVRVLMLLPAVLPLLLLASL